MDTHTDSLTTTRQALVESKNISGTVIIDTRGVAVRIKAAECPQTFHPNRITATVAQIHQTCSYSVPNGLQVVKTGLQCHDLVGSVTGSTDLIHCVRNLIRGQDKQLIDNISSV